jgi:hypothetical protein
MLLPKKRAVLAKMVMAIMIMMMTVICDCAFLQGNIANYTWEKVEHTVTIWK